MSTPEKELIRRHAAAISKIENEHGILLDLYATGYLQVNGEENNTAKLTEIKNALNKALGTSSFRVDSHTSAHVGNAPEGAKRTNYVLSGYYGAKAQELIQAVTALRHK
jgi:hypothetical protein